MQGVTNNKVDISVDIIRIVTLPLLAKWGVTEGCSLQITKRGAEPLVGVHCIVNRRGEAKSSSAARPCASWTPSVSQSPEW